MAETIQVGEKGRNITISDGWRRLGSDEVVHQGDRVANIHTAIWMNVDGDDIGFTAEVVGEAVIRELSEIEKFRNNRNTK